MVMCTVNVLKYITVTLCFHNVHVSQPVLTRRRSEANDVKMYLCFFFLNQKNMEKEGTSHAYQFNFPL